MKRSLSVLTLAAFAALASSQTPTTVYAEAKREQKTQNASSFVNDSGVPHDYDLNFSQGDFFRVVGDADTADAAGQSIPWGMTWRDLCDNSWTYSQRAQIHLDPHWGFTQVNSFYTIDKSYGAETPDPDDDDSSNGDDIIVAGTTTWVRTCTALVTNSITWTTGPTIAEDPGDPLDPTHPSGPRGDL